MNDIFIGPHYAAINHRYFYTLHFLPDGLDITKWHTYSVTWSANSVIFRVDDVVTYTVTKPQVEKYGRWAFDNPKFLIINFALGGGYPKGVNKVSAPYPGLPESTVQKIKKGKAEFLIDWVLVTKQ